MSALGKMPASEQWIRALLHLYPRDFREEMGDSIVETYRDRCRSAVARGGRLALAGVWLGALLDSLRNGFAERLRPSVIWRRSGNWGRDMEIAARRLARAPVFALAMVATLTVGLGAFAVVYTVVQKVLLSPLPYERPGDLYYVWRDYRAILDLDRGWLGGPDIAMLDTAGGPIAAAAGIRRDRRTLASMSATEGEPEEVPVMAVTPNLFSLLGVRPMLGRGFAPDEVGPNRPAVVVLGHDLWQRRFGGDRQVIGTDVRLNGTPFRVIGVMGPDFHFVRHASLGPPEGGEVFITFSYALGEMNPNNGSFAGIVRARPGASPQQIAAAVSAVGKALDEKSFNGKGLKLWPIGMKEDLVAPMRPALLVLAASGAFLVLVLAVNLATLLLARAMQREREFAVSRALGANGGALVRATLFEAGLLGALGGATATLVAIWGTRALVAIAPLDLPRRESIAVDWSVATTIVLIGALLGLMAGIAPAAWASRSSLGTLLRNSAVRGGGGRGRLRRALVVVQVALCLVLLSAGGLVGRSFERLLRSQPGFAAQGVLTMRVAIAQWRYPTNASAVAFHERLERELKGIAGVEAVGAASAVPLTARPGTPG
jgi:putative ABC transport system permease protein